MFVFVCGICDPIALPPGWVIDSFIARLCFVMIMAQLVVFVPGSIYQARNTEVLGGKWKG